MALNVINVFQNGSNGATFTGHSAGDELVVFLVARNDAALNQSTLDNHMVNQGFERIWSYSPGSNRYIGAFKKMAETTTSFYVNVPSGYTISLTGFRIVDGFVDEVQTTTTGLQSTVNVGTTPTYILGQVEMRNLSAMSGYNFYSTHWSSNAYLSTSAVTGTRNVLSNTSNNGEIRLLIREFKTIDYGYNGGYHTFVAPYTGSYQLEVWGAEGGTSPGYAPGGKGGYARGRVNLVQGDKLYIYVGQKGVDGGSGNYAAYNGGGKPYQNHTYTAGGGGATDIRVSPGFWDNNISLLSRILVAGGGGGGGAENGVGNEYSGNGGGLTGTDGGSPRYPTATNYAKGGTQTAAGGPVRGGFGFGAQPTTSQAGAGGGGWYGGGAQSNAPDAGGGGGSGYVLTSSSYKPSGYSPTSKYWMSGTSMSTGIQSGNGTARITLIDRSVVPETPVFTQPTSNLAQVGENVLFSWTNVKTELTGDVTYELQIRYDNVWTQVYRGTNTSYTAKIKDVITQPQSTQARVLASNGKGDSSWSYRTLIIDGVLFVAEKDGELFVFNNGWKKIGTSEDLTEELILKENWYEINTVTKAQWDELGEFELIAYRSNANPVKVDTMVDVYRPFQFYPEFEVQTSVNNQNEPVIKETALPHPQSSIMARDLSVLDVAPNLIKDISELLIETTVTGNGDIRILVAPNDTGVFYRITSGEWIEVDVEDMDQQGMMPSEVQEILGHEWKALLGDDPRTVRFAYWLSQESLATKTELTEINLTVGIRPAWEKASENIFDYAYVTNEQIQVILYENGDYKINGRFLESGEE